jgi:hypothetical protein
MDDQWEVVRRDMDDQWEVVLNSIIHLHNRQIVSS